MSMGPLRIGLPSPAMLVAIIALVFAAGGTALAGVATVSVLSKTEKKQTRNIADNEVNRLAPSLSVRSAGSANTADSANVADNASRLGGKTPGDYLLAESRGVALAGAHISATSGGVVSEWFNRLGGEPTLTHTPGSGVFDVAFPGVDALQTVEQGTLVSSAGFIDVVGATSGGVTFAHVVTRNTSATLTDLSFFVVLYGASFSG